MKLKETPKKLKKIAKKRLKKPKKSKKAIEFTVKVWYNKSATRNGVPSKLK